MSGGRLHSDEVFSWRETRFIELGFAGHEARALAATRIDLHEMKTLLKNGCSHDVAWQILTGTMFNGLDPLWRESDKGGYMAASEDLDYDFAAVAVAVEDDGA